jgi:hypothetical protein
VGLIMKGSELAIITSESTATRLDFIACNSGQLQKDWGQQGHFRLARMCGNPPLYLTHTRVYLLVYINCTKKFHCETFLQVYNVL